MHVSSRLSQFVARFLAALLVATGLVAIQSTASAPVHAATTVYESEPNGSISSATVVPLGASVLGSASSAGNDDSDYFAFDVAKAGKATFNLVFPSGLGTGSAYEVKVYNQAGVALYDFNLSGGDYDGSWLWSQGVFLPAGRAYVRIYGYAGWDSWGKSYVLTVSLSVGRVELEPNGSTSSATVVPLGASVLGSASSAGSDDSDYFAFDVAKAGRYPLSFIFPSNLGTGSAYEIKMYDQSGNFLYEFQVYGNDGNGSSLRSQTINLPEGRNYLRVYGYAGWATWGKTYNLTLGTPPPVPPSSYVPLTPARVLDTRSGNGVPKGPVAAGGTVALQVTGRGGVPASGVAAVVLNVTSTGASAYGFLIGYPTGIARPATSILNYYPGKDIANQSILKVGAGGKVSIYANSKTNVVADVLGYYPTAGGKFVPVNPARIVDTTAGVGAAKVPVAKAGTVSFKVAGVGGVPANATVVALNVTTFQPAGAGFATVWPAGAAKPISSNTNYVAGQKVASMVLVKVGAGGMVNYFSYQKTNVLVDVMGYGTSASDIKALTPARLVDTRTTNTPLGNGGSTNVKVTGRAGVPASGVKAVVVNVTVVGPTGAGFATVYPTGVARPVASNVNYTTGVTVPNSVIAKVGANGQITVYSYKKAHVIVDVLAYITG